MPHRIESPFSFRLAEKKTAIHGQKKRRCIQPCTCVQGWGNGFCENCNAGEELCTKSRAKCGFHPALCAVLIKLQISGCKEDTLCSSPRCRSPSSSEGFPKGKAPKRRRGRIKRGAFEEMARLAAHQGRESYRRDGVRWRPPCFGWGSKGEGALRQRLLPLAP